MAATLAVIGSPFVERAVVVVKHQMLAFVADDVRDALEISLMFGDDESAGVQSQYHSGSRDVAALIVVAPGVLACPDSYVR